MFGRLPALLPQSTSHVEGSTLRPQTSPGWWLFLVPGRFTLGQLHFGHACGRIDLCFTPRLRSSHPLGILQAADPPWMAWLHSLHASPFQLAGCAGTRGVLLLVLLSHSNWQLDCKSKRKNIWLGCRDTNELLCSKLTRMLQKWLCLSATPSCVDADSLRALQEGL